MPLRRILPTLVLFFLCGSLPAAAQDSLQVEFTLGRDTSFTQPSDLLVFRRKAATPGTEWVIELDSIPRPVQIRRGPFRYFIRDALFKRDTTDQAGKSHGRYAGDRENGYFFYARTQTNPPRYYWSVPDSLRNPLRPGFHMLDGTPIPLNEVWEDREDEVEKLFCDIYRDCDPVRFRIEDAPFQPSDLLVFRERGPIQGRGWVIDPDEIPLDPNFVFKRDKTNPDEASQSRYGASQSRYAEDREHGYFFYIRTPTDPPRYYWSADYHYDSTRPRYHTLDGALIPLHEVQEDREADVKILFCAIYKDCPYDLAVSITSKNEPARGGDTLTFTVTLSNEGENSIYKLVEIKLEPSQSLANITTVGGAPNSTPFFRESDLTEAVTLDGFPPSGVSESIFKATVDRAYSSQDSVRVTARLLGEHPTDVDAENNLATFSWRLETVWYAPLVGWWLLIIGLLALLIGVGGITLRRRVKRVKDRLKRVDKESFMVNTDSTLDRLIARFIKAPEPYAIRSSRRPDQKRSESEAPSEPESPTPEPPLEPKTSTPEPVTLEHATPESPPDSSTPESTLLDTSTHVPPPEPPTPEPATPEPSTLAPPPEPERGSIVLEPIDGGESLILVPVDEPLEPVTPKPEPPPSPRTPRLFISYAREDEAMRVELGKHLRILERRKTVEIWHDRMIAPGEDWMNKIDKELEGADIIVLLVSADFLNSDYAYGKEMKRALERHQAGEARVIPIIVRAAAWKLTPLWKLQALPEDAHPITQWSHPDKAWEEVTLGINQVAQELRPYLPPEVPSA